MSHAIDLGLTMAQTCIEHEHGSPYAHRNEAS